MSDQKGPDCPVSPFHRGFPFQFLFNVRLMVYMDLGLYTADFVQSVREDFFYMRCLANVKMISSNFMLRGGLKCKK